jgi:predicted nicotinamide N-methyase
MVASHQGGWHQGGVKLPMRASLPTVGDAAALDRILPDHIFDIAYAFRKSKALLSAVELGVFTALGDGPLDGATLMARVGVHPRGGRDFLDALVALDFLDRDEGGRYANRPDCALYLDQRKSSYVGGSLELLNSHLYVDWFQLTQALRTGHGGSALADGGYAGLYADRASFDTFLQGMSGSSLMPARSLAERFPWHRHETVIDVGTAQGCMPVELARGHAHLRGGGFDLPQVEPAFTNYVRRNGLSDRLRFYPGDFLRDDLPKADVLVMGRILHNWDLATKKLLLRKAAQALPDGGALIVYDNIIDDERRHRPHSLLASLNMLIETAAGFEYTDSECGAWMRESGFRDIRIERLDPISTAAIGIR